MISTRNLECANKDPLCQGPIIRVRCWQVEVSLEGEVAIGENHRRDQSPHVEGEHILAEMIFTQTADMLAEIVSENIIGLLSYGRTFDPHLC